jgi:hypothetical protein
MTTKIPERMLFLALTTLTAFFLPAFAVEYNPLLWATPEPGEVCVWKSWNEYKYTTENSQWAPFAFFRAMTCEAVRVTMDQDVSHNPCTYVAGTKVCYQKATVVNTLNKSCVLSNAQKYGTAFWDTLHITNIAQSQLVNCTSKYTIDEMLSNPILTGECMRRGIQAHNDALHPGCVTIHQVILEGIQYSNEIAEQYMKKTVEITAQQVAAERLKRQKTENEITLAAERGKGDVAREAARAESDVMGTMARAKSDAITTIVGPNATPQQRLDAMIKVAIAQNPGNRYILGTNSPLQLTESV